MVTTRKSKVVDAAMAIAQDGVPDGILDAERSVLAALMLDLKCLPAVRTWVGPGSFYRTAHAKIFAALERLSKNESPADLITLVDELRREDELEVVGGAGEVAHLLELATTTANVIHHAQLVAEHHAHRMTRQAALNLLQGTMNGDNLGELVANCQVQLGEALRVRGAREKTPSLIEQVITAQQLFADEEPAAPDVVGHRFMVEGGFTILVGLAGFGKTFLALQAMRGICRGTGFLGMYTAQGRAGMLQLEMPRFAIRERLREPVEGFELLSQPRGFRELSDPRTTDDVTRWCENSRLKLLVADPLAYLQRRDENAAVELDPFIDAVNRIRSRTGVHVMVLHHVNKITFDKQASLRTNVLLAVRGSTRLTAEPDNVLGLVQRQGRVMLVNAKTRLCPSPEFYCVRQLPAGEPDEGYFALTDTPTEVADATDAKILKALSFVGEKGATVDEIMRLTETSRSTVQRHLDELDVTVLTESRGKKRYFLNEESPQEQVPF